MPRPIALACLLLVLIITSQFEWKMQLANDLDPRQGILEKKQHIVNKEAIKEKIILSQEKKIQQLEILVKSLQQQLLQCQVANKPLNVSGTTFVTNASEIRRQYQAPED